MRFPVNPPERLLPFDIRPRSWRVPRPVLVALLLLFAVLLSGCAATATTTAGVTTNEAPRFHEIGR
jgi:hypothetical protein